MSGRTVTQPYDLTEAQEASSMSALVLQCSQDLMEQPSNDGVTNMQVICKCLLP